MTELPAAPAESGRRSAFVTVVACVFIVLSALATLGSMMSVSLLAVTPAATVHAVVTRVIQDTTVTNLLPAPYLFMMHHAYLVAGVKLAWWIVVLVASVGVLRRQEWARRAFVAVLGIETVAVTVGLVMGQMIGMSLARQLASTSQSGQVPEGMGSGLALGGLLVVGMVAILLWLLFTFRSARVREEFASPGRAA